MFASSSCIIRNKYKYNLRVREPIEKKILYSLKYIFFFSMSSATFMKIQHTLSLTYLEAQRSSNNNSSLVFSCALPIVCYCVYVKKLCAVDCNLHDYVVVLLIHDFVLLFRVRLLRMYHAFNS